MPYVPHTLVSLRGTLGAFGAPVESWSIGFRFAEPEDPAYNPPIPRTGLANDIWVLSAALFTSGSFGFTSSVRLTEAKVAAINADGHYAGEPDAHFQLAGGAGASPIPFQLSQVVTFFTGGLGKGRFGRVYLPPMSYDVDINGVITDAVIDARLAQFKTYLRSLQALMKGEDLATHLVVASKTGTAGVNHGVEKIRWGKVIDTQRRRRRSLKEGYRETDLDLPIP